VPGEILDLIHKEDVEVLLHPGHHRADHARLLDELGQAVGVEPAAGRHIAPLIRQAISR